MGHRFLGKPFELIKSASPSFVKEHTPVLILMLLCEISAGLWLIQAFLIQDAVDSIRKKQVEEFIASAPGNEPPPPSPPEPSPHRLRRKRANTLTFVLIVIMLLHLLASMRLA
jgi:hypothetical protein